MKLIFLIIGVFVSTTFCGNIPKEDITTRVISLSDKCIIITSNLVGVSGKLRSQLCCKQPFTEESKNIINNLNEEKHSLEILKSHEVDFEEKDGKSDCKHQARYIFEKKTVFGNRLNPKKPRVMINTETSN